MDATIKNKKEKSDSNIQKTFWEMKSNGEFCMKNRLISLSTKTIHFFLFTVKKKAKNS
jgi:hypothetical protein